MSAAHTFAVGDRATVVGSDYDVDTRAHREIVLAVCTVARARARVRLDNGAEYARREACALRHAGWFGYGGASGRLRPYQPGDDERLAERRAEEALDAARRRRKDVDGYVDRARLCVVDARKHFDEMERERDQAQADVAAAEARLAEARAAVAAIGGAS